MAHTEIRSVSTPINLILFPITPPIVVLTYQKISAALEESTLRVGENTDASHTSNRLTENFERKDEGLRRSVCRR